MKTPRLSILAGGAEVVRLDGVVAIIVTYHPDHLLIAKLVNALSEVGAIIIVDNASSGDDVAHLQRITVANRRVFLVAQSVNSGLAQGINEGMRAARAALPGLSAYIWLDQDSEFSSDALRELIAGLNRAQKAHNCYCCVGPMMVDVSTGMAHGFHYVRNGWLWARAYPPSTDTMLFPVSNLNGSGTVVPAALVDRIGGLDEGFFIDHVDTEWSFRVLANEGQLFGVPAVSFQHRMGERGRRIWLLGWRVWPDRSPGRHYYLFRNAMTLLRRPYVPLVWKYWAILKLLATALIVSIYGPQRIEQLRQIIRGASSGRR